MLSVIMLNVVSVGDKHSSFFALTRSIAILCIFNSLWGICPWHGRGTLTKMEGRLSTVDLIKVARFIVVLIIFALSKASDLN
jgi:hypothetical protein